MRFLLFAPALGFGLVAVICSALALRGDRIEDAEEVIARSRRLMQVALVAAVLCALSLLVGSGYFLLQSLPLED